MAQSNGNWIAGLSDDEFQSLLGFVPPVGYTEPSPDPSLKDRDFPERFDWRELNGVTPVKSQGQCGSCWAFAATAVLESQVYIATGTPPDYSEQQLVDCTPMCYGCNGGNYDYAWDYLKEPGFILEADYPYQAQNLPCEQRYHDPYIRVLTYQYINTSEDSIKANLMDYGPVACSIGANSNLKEYTGGCYEDPSTTSINHAVVIVGWDDNICPNGSWIVKNSWGSSWGDNGFFTINRGDVHIGSYSAIAYYEEIPPVRIQVIDTTIQDGNDGVPETGETVGLSAILSNIGRETATGVTATIETAHPAVTITKDTISIPDIPAKTTTGPADCFEFTLGNVEPAEQIDFTLTIQFDGGQSHEVILCHCGPLYLIYISGFDGSTDEGWTHGYTRRRDNWARGMPQAEQLIRWDPMNPHSGECMWGNNLENEGNYIANMSNYLVSPVFDCTGMTSVRLSFWRWLTVEESRFDQARIIVNDEEIWCNPYEGHLIDTQWTRCVYDISDIAADQSEVQIMFTLDSDEGLHFGGWSIDDFSLFTGVDARFEDTFKDPVAVKIETSMETYQPGDWFELAVTTNNYQDARRVDQWILLDVFNQYWFWPAWSDTADFESRDLSPRCSIRESILEFTWPEIEGHAQGIRFWVGILDNSSGEVLDYDMAQWGW